MPDYLAGGGLSWGEIKSKLESEGAKNKAYDSDVDGVFDAEAIPDLDASKITSGVFDLARIPTITRDKLEYPTEDVSFAYLAAIDKLQYSSQGGNAVIIVTLDSFADKAIEAGVNPRDYPHCIARHSNKDNHYLNLLAVELSTADHVLLKRSAGTGTNLATESVDIDTTGEVLCLSCSGSAIKSLRYIFGSPTQSIANVTPTATISATDTDHASGKFGVRPIRDIYSHGYCDTTTARLIAPQTKLPQPLAIVEYEITGDGSDENPIRPVMPEELVEITKLTLPLEEQFLLEEAKKYELLKSKGFTDEEIRTLLGYVPQHQVNVLAVTWGAFDHKPEHNTMLITIISGNPYTGEKAILGQIEHAKSKNLKVLKPPRDYSEAVEQYRQLRKDFPEWTAGKDNYAYQTLGHEDFEKFQVADTYHGNIIEGIKPDAYKNVPDWEMRRTLAMWKERLRRVTIVKSEAEKHLKKLEEVEKIGW